METIEVYNGIARAVEAAKPAQEYCLLWIPHWSACMTKAEWSGWMQAIFSVLAIYFSSRIAFSTLEKQRRVAAEDALTLAALLADTVDAHVIMGRELDSVDAARLVRAGFLRISNSGINLRLDLLPRRCRYAANGLLSIAGQAVAALDRIIEKNDVDAINRVGAFDVWISRVGVHAKVIRDEFSEKQDLQKR